MVFECFGAAKAENQVLKRAPKTKEFFEKLSSPSIVKGKYN